MLDQRLLFGGTPPPPLPAPQDVPSYLEGAHCCTSSCRDNDREVCDLSADGAPHHDSIVGHGVVR